MKLFKHKLGLLVLGALLAIPAWADQTTHPAYQMRAVVGDRYDVEKLKHISRSFKVTSSSMLAIENKYGKVHINTWDKNEIVVNVEIVARARSEERAQAILDMIQVSINESGDGVTCRTEFVKGQNNFSNWGNNRGYEVNYTISMPRKNPLRLKNSYGDAYVANYGGNADLNVSYGSLKTDRLDGTSTIRLAYGSGESEYIRQGELNIAYSRFTVADADRIKMHNSYSQIDVRRAKSLEMESKYGSVDIATVGSLQGTAGYTNVSIKQLMNKLDMHVRYGGGFKIGNISPDFQSIAYDGSYSSVDLTFDQNVGFNFDVNLRYGNLHADHDDVKYRVMEQRNSSGTYQGTFGKSSGAIVRVTSEYGDVHMRTN